jgi:hypothetical protein
MRAYDPAAWVPFFTAMIAAAAALTGLLFVAVSINLVRMLDAARGLPARSAETLATLLLVVVSSALALIPQSTRLLGLEIVIVVVPMLGSPCGASSATGAGTAPTRCCGLSPG